MAGFVQDRFHIALDAHGVHEDERQARFGQGGLVAAGALPLRLSKSSSRSWRIN